ncbi:MAG: methyltransferase domain-containing protein [Deltaproteobacteria bacterium]|nr:MAG: methyltransferase domain-containing protein [Deltaproteobacteria bacterium]
MIDSDDSDPTAPKPYAPSLSPAEVERLRVWHERAYQAMRDRKTSNVTHLGRVFTVPPHVFPPAPMSEILGLAVLAQVRPRDRVLDMGTGSGVNAILAASRSTEVVAVDINPHAVVCARQNASAHGVSSRITFFESDVFEAVEGTFDLILFDPPFRWFAPRDTLEASIADEGYRALTRFMAEAPARLRPGGRILLFFGTSGDLDYLRGLIERSTLTSEVVAERQLTRGAETVRYLVYRLKAPPSSA